MRFCILYTCCSSLRQGNVRQLSLSGSRRDFSLILGAFVFVIRLVPLSSISPCSRLPILGITPGIRFLSNPSRRQHWLAPPCRLDHRQGHTFEFSRSDDLFCVALGLCSPPDSCRVKENVWKPFSQGLQ